MKIVVAPDKFKGTLSSMQFCYAAKNAVKKYCADFEVIALPLSDGGDGFVDVFHFFGSFQKIRCKVLDPLFRPIEAYYLLSDDRKTAVIEMAKVSGLHLLEEGERNCMLTSTYGLGQMILDALKQGVETVIIGLGGSATNDGGTGMASALGCIFKDKEGKKIQTVGGQLLHIASIDDDQLKATLGTTRFILVSDVNNPLLGANGAVNIYARQKGASGKDLKILEEGLSNLADRIFELRGVSIANVEGAGAAGGLGGGGLAFLDAEVRKGAEFVLEMVDFDEKMTDADLIITGEGSFDQQSSFGKLPVVVAKRARDRSIPVLAVVGSADNAHDSNDYFDYLIELKHVAPSIKEAKNEAFKYVEKIIYDFLKAQNY